MGLIARTEVMQNILSVKYMYDTHILLKKTSF